MAQDRQTSSATRPCSTGRRSRIGRSLAATALSGVIVVSGLVGGQGSAAAAPDTVSEAKSNLDAISAQTAKIQDSYTKAQAQLDTTSKKLATANKDLTAQRAKVSSMRSTLSSLAVNDYQSGGVSLTAQLVTSGDSAQFLSKLATVQNVSDRTKSQFLAFQTQQGLLQTLEKQAAADRATIKSNRDAQAKLLKQSQAKQDEANQILDRLTAQEKERLAQEQAAAAAANLARAAAQTSRSNSRSAAPSTSASSTPRKASSSSSASGRAAPPIAFAMSKVGGPYVMGGTGPTAYDCSGLMQAAWASAGVSLPRTSEEQFNAGTPVSTGSLQPGDLVFYYGVPPSHVAMYIGNGQIVHAANPSAGIKTSPVGEMPIAGARRVG
ncbi:MAG: NlpC/P60 family protein [Acidipropionibacterium jensenii]|uniref:C40 family peptidase n=1 Tax=Acidipropionibacterium jensenii TaxID=1749 RepID=UPI0026495D2A|nr:C40 family peptidase [Acidipropionibacterium jensenii]MDN6811324.1 NlpC/P60 family protein [Acidipropionibacterium jensenii]